MDKAQANSVEKFISNWNGEFPNYPLTAAELNKPHALMGALLQAFDRLGIDREAVISPLPEESRNEHTTYFWDLIPVINMTRVINHLIKVMPQANVSISITHFLQPMITSSFSIVYILFNLMVFNEDRLRDISPYEEELFAKTGEVKSLEDKKNKLLEMLNEQAEEIGKRAERLEKLDHDTKQYEEELKIEKEAHEVEKQELETLTKEVKQLEILLDQKKSHRDGLIADIERKRALRVYDGDDIKAQVEQAAASVQEAEEKLNSLKATLMQKENCLKNLQSIKPNLDTAINLLHEIMKWSESLKDYENGDLDTDSKDGELDVLNTELIELEAHLSELKAARCEAAAKRQEAQVKRQYDRMLAESALREAEEKDRKCRERCKKAVQRTQEIKELTAQYETQRVEGMDILSKIKNNFVNELKAMDEYLLKKVTEVEKRIEDRLRNRDL